MSVVSFPGQGADSEGATGVAGTDTHHMPLGLAGLGHPHFLSSWVHHSHGITEILKPLAVPLMALSIPGRAAASSPQDPAESHRA